MKTSLLIESDRIKELMGINSNSDNVISEQKVLIDILKSLVKTAEKDEVKVIEKYFKGEIFNESERKILADYLKTSEGKKLIGLMRQQVAAMSDDVYKKKLLYRIRNLENISYAFGQGIKDKEAAELAKKTAAEATANEIKKNAEDFYNIVKSSDKSTLDTLTKTRLENTVKAMESLKVNDEVWSLLSKVTQDDFDAVLKAVKEKQPNLYTKLKGYYEKYIGSKPLWVKALFWIAASGGLVCGVLDGFPTLKQICVWISDKIKAIGSGSSSSSGGGIGVTVD
jgi:hypothetical protein